MQVFFIYTPNILYPAARVLMYLTLNAFLVSSLFRLCILRKYGEINSINYLKTDHFMNILYEYKFLPSTNGIDLSVPYEVSRIC